MNFEAAKALRIELWRKALDNQDFRMENPEAYRSCLIECSAQLAAEKLINRIEQYDMDEMANAAYWHAVEELQSNPIIYRSSYQYDVIPCDGGPRIGTIFHSVLSLDGNRDNRLKPYDGTIHRDKTGLKLQYSSARDVGRIEGLTLTMEDGSQFDLIETKRMVLNKVYPAIEDPDVYRWMVDVVQVATENRDLEIVRRIRPFLELAKFIRCPTCLDRFGKREDCTPCSGLGFVGKPRSSGKLPQEGQGQPKKPNDLGDEHVRRS
jgi:hypothetical protein